MSSPPSPPAGAPLEKPQVIAHAQQGLSYTVFDCRWVPCSARLLCLGSFPRGTGVIELYELQGGRLRLLRQTMADLNPNLLIEEGRFRLAQ
ncbi:UNVERIFIED_CONTAM: WD repeat-containing protein 92 [Gekko kuhli]